jgi:hypothetical protein
VTTQACYPAVDRESVSRGVTGGEFSSGDVIAVSLKAGELQFRRAADVSEAA